MSNYKRNFSYNNFLPCLLLILMLFLVSCSRKISLASNKYEFKSKDGIPDFSNLNYWAASPFKMDPSDNVPADLKNEIKDTIADVFFIHPTTYTDAKMPMGWNAQIDDEELNKKTDNSAILYQASVFNKYCRVFAPRYRQANLRAFYTDDKKMANAALELAYEDVKNAFEYYLKNYNNGRPIIIASHSQGTFHAGKLLKDFFENKLLKNNW